MKTRLSSLTRAHSLCASTPTFITPSSAVVTPTFPLRRRAVCLGPLLAGVLGACGGGDDGEPTIAPPSPSPTPAGGTTSAGPGPNGANGTALRPMPLLSRGKPVYTNNAGAASAAIDGLYQDSSWTAQPTANQAHWLAIDLGTGPSQVVLNWSAWEQVIINPNVMPLDYRIETSADSTNGADGQWKIAVEVQDNDKTDAWRSHPVNFQGQRWIRLVVTAGDPANQGRAVLHEIDVHDASNGLDDTWLFVGDSITAASFVGLDNGVAQRLHTAHPAYWPMMMNTGISGTTATQGLARLDHLLQVHSHVRHWVVSYGTNDSRGSAPLNDLARFTDSMRGMATRLKAAGKVVFMPTIPWKVGGEAYLPQFNAAIVQLRNELGVMAGPDLYAHFLKNPTHMSSDGYHPSAEGRAAINQLWAEVLTQRYPS